MPTVVLCPFSLLTMPWVITKASLWHYQVQNISGGYGKVQPGGQFYAMSSLLRLGTVFSQSCDVYSNLDLHDLVCVRKRFRRHLICVDKEHG